MMIMASMTIGKVKTGDNSTDGNDDGGDLI